MKKIKEKLNWLSIALFGNPVRYYFPRENTEKKYAQSLLFSHLSRRKCEGGSCESVEFIVYYGDQGADSHFSIWDPTFKSYEGRYISVFRNQKAYFSLNKRNREKVYPVSKIKDLDSLLCRTENLKAILYPANNGVNLQAIRNSSLKHIFIGHGDSDKISSANKVLRLYDEVWVAGKAHIDRFVSTGINFSSIDFKVIGQPWMRDWLRDINRKVLHDDNVGYFPTWSGYFENANYSSLGQFEAISKSITSILINSNIIVKMHPWTDSKSILGLEEIALKNEKVIVLKKDQTLRNAMLKDMGCIVCDNSAALSESLYLQKPIFLYQNLDVEYPYDFKKNNAFCYIFSSIEEFNQMFKQVMVEGIDSKKQLRVDAFKNRIDFDAMEHDQFSIEMDRVLTNQ